MTRKREIEYSGQFQKDVKKAQKRHKDMSKLKTLMVLLINDDLPLPSVYKDHPLQGNFKTARIRASMKKSQQNPRFLYLP